MKLFEKEWVEKIQQDFQKFKSKNKFTASDQGQFLADLTGLLGWFNIDPSKKLKIIIEEMLIFGKKKSWEISGPKIAFEHMKKRHKIK